MIVLVTGTSSGIGKALIPFLFKHTVIEVNRDKIDLSDVQCVLDFDMPYVDMLVNCAGHDTGGKVPFKDHDMNNMVEIMTANTIAPMILTHKALQQNPSVRVLNVVSNNIHQYWPNDLAYTLSKVSLETFGDLLTLEGTSVQSIAPGLTKTNFNESRHKNNHKPIDDLYENDHLSPIDVAAKIAEMVENPKVKKATITP